ncbi:hypothetical protein C8Q70DRAFT_319300, partial [Cubamyces menziesii]
MIPPSKDHFRPNKQQKAAAQKYLCRRTQHPQYICASLAIAVTSFSRPLQVTMEDTFPTTSPMLTLIKALPFAVECEMPFHSREQLSYATHTLARVATGINRHLNSLLPIDRLPPEILLIIFGHVMRSDKIHREHLQQGRRIENRRLRITRPLSALIGLTHVCKRWRDVALSAPALWTNIGGCGRRELDAFVARSRSLPLFAHIVTESLADTAPVLAQHGGRMVRLDLTVVGEKPQYAPPALQFSAPLLQCLTIAFECQSHSPLELFTTVLFRTGVSDLKALALIHVNNFIPRNHFPHLTHLYIGTGCGLAEPGSEKATMCELFQLLANTPALQHLHLTGLFKWSSIAVPDAFIRAAVIPTGPIRLPALRSLTYTKGPTNFADRLLRLLELPPHALVRLDALYCPTADDSLAVPVAQAIPSRTFLSGLHHAELV